MEDRGKNEQRRTRIRGMDMKMLVKRILSATTFEVYPPWRWEKWSGIKVRVAGLKQLEAREVGYDKAKKHLDTIILNKEVELKNMQDIDYDCLVCDVHVDGKNVAELIQTKP